MSLTELSSAGFRKTSDASSSMREMFWPPSAVAWADTGSSRKLKTELPVCALLAEAASNRNIKRKNVFFISALNLSSKIH